MSPSARWVCLLGPVLACSALEAGEPRSPSKADSQVATRIDHFGDPLPPFALARLGTSRYHVPSRALSVILSPDGNTIAIGTEDSIILMDPKTGRERQRLSWRDHDDFDVFLSSDGSRVAAVDHAEHVTIWNAKSGRAVSKRLRGRLLRDSALGLSDHRGLTTRLGLRDEGLWIQALDLKAGETRLRVVARPSFDVDGGMMSPDGKTVAVWGPAHDTRRDQCIQFSNAETGKELSQARLKGDGMIVAGAFAPDGRRIAVLTTKANLRFFSCTDGKETNRIACDDFTPLLRNKLVETAPLVFSSDGSQIALGTCDGIVRVWDVTGGKRLRTRNCPISDVRSFTFVDGKVVACGLVGDSIPVWYERSGKKFGTRDGHASRIVSLVFSSDGNVLHSAAETGDLFDWDSRSATGKKIDMLAVEAEHVDWLLGRRFAAGRFAVSLGEKYAAVAGVDGMRLWDISAGRVAQTFPNVRTTSPIVAFAGHGDLLVLAHGRVNFYDVPDGVVRITLSGLPGPVECTTSSRDGRYVAAAAVYRDPSSADPTEIRVWRAEDGQEVSRFSFPERFPHGQDANQALALSPNGKLVAAVVSNDAVRVWDTEKRTAIAHLAAGEGTPGPLCFSPDSRLLAVGRTILNKGQPETRHGVIQLWEIASHKVRREFRGHDGAVTALAFSGDGRRLASGSSNSSILLWDATGDALLPHPDTKLIEAQRDSLWQQLASDDAAAGYKAIVQLCAAPKDAIEVLKSRVKPIPPGPTETEISRLVKLLDSPNPPGRALAQEKLVAAAQAAVPPLRKAIKGSSSADFRKRAEAVLMTILLSDGADDSIRLTRALEVLERIATPEARELVRSFALGRADHAFTLEAKSALARMQGQP